MGLSDVFGLSEDDLQLVRDMVSFAKRTPGASGPAPPGKTINRPPHILPDIPGGGMYLVLTPINGIPGLTEYVLPDRPSPTPGPDGLQTGTGDERGTGSDIGAGNIPGYAYCNVYRVNMLHDGTAEAELDKGSWYPELYPVPGSKLLVFNYNPVPIPGERWVPVTRDNYGTWFAITDSNLSWGTWNDWKTGSTPGGGIASLPKRFEAQDVKIVRYMGSVWNDMGWEVILPKPGIYLLTATVMGSVTVQGPSPLSDTTPFTSNYVGVRLHKTNDDNSYDDEVVAEGYVPILFSPYNVSVDHPDRGSTSFGTLIAFDQWVPSWLWVGQGTLTLTAITACHRKNVRVQIQGHPGNFPGRADFGSFDKSGVNQLGILNYQYLSLGHIPQWFEELGTGSLPHSGTFFPDP